MPSCAPRTGKHAHGVAVGGGLIAAGAYSGPSSFCSFCLSTASPVVTVCPCSHPLGSSSNAGVLGYCQLALGMDLLVVLASGLLALPTAMLTFDRPFLSTSSTACMHVLAGRPSATVHCT